MVQRDRVSANAHAVTRPSEPISIAHGSARVHMIPAASDNLSWLLEYRRGEVAVIDGPSFTPILEYCQRYQLCVTHIINTHIHGDHIGVNRGLAKAKVAKPDLFSLEMEVWGAEKTASSIPELTRGLVEGDSVTLGQLKGEVWLTEGHLDGHLSYVFWDQTREAALGEGSKAALFCGDTLFGAGCGKLFDGPPASMFSSLSRLSRLPSDTFVFCAHEYTEDNLRFAQFAYPDNVAISERLKQCIEQRSHGESTLPSTIELERCTNPFILCGTEDRFTELRAQKDRGEHRL